MRSRHLLPVLGVLALAAAAPARAGVTEFPPALFGHESVAAVEGAEAMGFNPAALGARYPSEFLVSWSDAESGPTSFRLLATGGGLGLGWSGVEDGPHALTLAGASHAGKVRMGWSVDWLSRAGDGRRATDAALGLLARPTPWLSLGATAAHLGEPRFDGVRLDRVYAVGLGLRPLAMPPALAHTLGPRLTLTADLIALEGATFDEAATRLGAELEPLPGIVLRGAYQDDGSFQLGLGLLGARAGYHGAAAWSDDRRRRSVTHTITTHRAEDRTVLAGAPERRIAEVRVGGTLGDDALAGVSLFGGEATTPSATLHRRLEAALEDPLTRGVLLDLRGVSNMAQIEELRPRIARLRAAGKPVVAFMEYGGGRGDFYLAAACNRVVATEEAGFAALGLRVERRYYRRWLADLGLRIDRVSVGAYKSAYRNFSVDSTPPADREAIERNLDVQQRLFVQALAKDRRIEPARFEAVLDGRQWTTADLQRAGVVDSAGFHEDARRILGQLCGLGNKPRHVELARIESAERAWLVPHPIAVVYASGGIEIGRSGSDLLNGPYLGSETLIPQLERAFRDRDVKAVVLRIESPGGSSLATSLIHHATEQLKRETGKPLIVSMGGVAASGGYHLALPGDRVFADHFTRTGSIGVLFVKPSLEGWYRQHGVRQDEFERGDAMGGWSLGRDWNARAQASADSAIHVTYSLFKARVASARGLDAAQVEQVARGRVWMADDALERRLVDSIGGLEDAVAEARRRAGIPAGERIAPLEFRRPRPGFVERLVGTTLGQALTRAVRLPEYGTIEFRADDEEE
jgi:protease-4